MIVLEPLESRRYLAAAPISTNHEAHLAHLAHLAHVRHVAHIGHLAHVADVRHVRGLELTADIDAQASTASYMVQRDAASADVPSVADDGSILFSDTPILG
jgi:hypothetical protein